MKKETYNLLLRLIAGLAASLILVGGTALLGDKMNEGRTGLLYQASGIPTDAVVMTVDGQEVTAEEYLYYLLYNCDMISSMGLSDMTMELGEGVTVADYARQQADTNVVARAVSDAWAAEDGITLTAEEETELSTQLAEVDYAAAGLSRHFFETQLRSGLLTNHIMTEYTTEGGKLYPSAEDIAAGHAAAAGHDHEHTDADIAGELYTEELSARCMAAEVVYVAKYMDDLDVAGFYGKMNTLRIGG